MNVNVVACLFAVIAPSLVAAGKCTESVISPVCKCDHNSWGNYQCSKCKDTFKWGYGCDLECPKDKCPFGCDPLGNCNVPAECKRNGRVDNPSVQVINERGECQACESGFCGLYCTKRCPKNCFKSFEGHCSRGGECYRCNSGFYGRGCDKLCPASCPDCVIMDDVVKAPDGQSFLPAGSCPEQCEVDASGPTCSDACPEHCKKTQGLGHSARIPSCLKENGFCTKCQDHKWWGNKCEKACSSGCGGDTCDKKTGLCDAECKHGWYGPNCDAQCHDGCKGKACDKRDGKCEDGCNIGHWGDYCKVDCPGGTEPNAGCKRGDGEPEACVSGSYPWLDPKGPTWNCATCPDNCINGQCDSDGHCTEGCEPGFYGDDCNMNCPPHCDGPCDTKATNGMDGWCPACEIGFTGKKCTKKCHHTCKACRQRNDGVTEDACTTCREDEPVEMVDGVCKCIEGANRNPETGSCECSEPKDPSSEKMGRFELKPNKMCRFICKEHLREVFGDKESMCVTNEVYKSVVRAELDGFSQGGCSDSDYEIPISGGKKCIRTDFVANIVEG